MKFAYKEHFSKALENIRQEKRYRTFTPLEKSPRSFPRAISHKAQQQEVTLWGTNDYLGLSMSKEAIAAAQEQAAKGGVGSGGTRNISGTHPLHVSLEKALAKLHNKERALLFNSGYTANEWTLFTLGRLMPGCTILSDAHNHASMIAGICASGANKLIFKHNSVDHLHALLKSLPVNVPKVIACESVYSMEGDFAPLEDFCALARQHNALLYLDEVHAVGLYGQTGGGLSEVKGLQGEVHLIQGTLAKAFGTIGGYVAGDETLIDVVRSQASGFIFSTALPAMVLAAALSNVKRVMTCPEMRRDFWLAVEQTKKALTQRNIPFSRTDSHILPLIVGDGERLEKMANTLLTQHHIYLQAVNYPTVPRGTERFRITPLRAHSTQMIHHFADALSQVWHQHTF